MVSFLGNHRARSMQYIINYFMCKQTSEQSHRKSRVESPRWGPESRLFKPAERDKINISEQNAGRLSRESDVLQGMQRKPFMRTSTVRGE